MITCFDVYLITKLDEIKLVLGCLLLPISGSLLWTIDHKNKLIKIIPIVMLLLIGICFLIIPSTKQAAAIYLIPKLANNNEISQIPINLAKIINAKANAEVRTLFNEGK